jgi:phosphate-selective porin OprO/OprP
MMVPVDRGSYERAASQWGVPELWGIIFVGRTKEGFSMNKVMNGYAGWTMERQMALDVIPILADGVKWLGYLPKSRIFWNVGAFTDWLSKDQSFSTFKSQYALRIGWLPIYTTDKKTVLHLGISYRYGRVDNGEISLSSRPESNPSPKFIDTGKFLSDYSNHIGGEVYFNSGPWMIGSEVLWGINSILPLPTTLFFFRWRCGSQLYDKQVNHVPIVPVLPYFGFVSGEQNLFFKGGPGAWGSFYSVPQHLI